MVGERVAVTNEDIYNLCQQILNQVNDYGVRLVRGQEDVKSRIERVYNTLKTQLDEIYEGIKTLSDNQAVIDEKIEDIRSRLDTIRSVVEELRAV